MGRLTERQSAGYDLKEMDGAWCDNYCEEQSKAICKDCAIWKAIQKLAHYEDLEEQGRLIDMNKIDFRCSYPSDCIANTEDCKQCDYYVCEFKYIAEAQLKELKEGVE